MSNRELLYREFGILLAAERRRKHLSQARFGAQVGLSRTSVTNIECGRQPIQLHTLYLFAAVLQTDLTKLLPKESALNEIVAPAGTFNEKQASYIEQVRQMITRAEKGAQGGDRDR